MNSTTQFLIFSFLLFAVLAQRDIGLTATCIGNTICPSGYAIAVNASNGYSNNTCVNTGVCTGSNRWTGVLFNCTQDYAGTGCPSKVCYSVHATSGCVNGGYGCNFVPFSSDVNIPTTQTCGQCSSGKVCANNLCVNTTSYNVSNEQNPTSSSQTCLTNATKCLWDSAQTTFQNCLSSYFGPSCGCCQVTAYNGVVDNLGYCTTNTFLDVPMINNYVLWSPLEFSRFAFIALIVIFLSVSI